ncbi:MAG: GNAT family N-acetyltransferase [Synechococcales cyanobacterium C42_A2020_086]|nr:GNAT family N-acetyltransferase [Synechococcales cyanobacterium C42_A2020_086]
MGPNPDWFPSPATAFVLRRARLQDGWQLRSLLRLAKREERLLTRKISWQLKLMGGLLIALGLYGLSALVGLRVMLYGLLAVALLGVAIWLYPPISLEYSRFWVVEHRGRLLACGQLSNCMAYPGGYSLLSDVVVARPWQRQGIGSFLVKELSRRVPHPLYLLTAPRHLEFYRRLGFEVVPPWQVAAAIRVQLGLAHRPTYLLLVRYPNQDFKNAPSVTQS